MEVFVRLVSQGRGGRGASCCKSLLPGNHGASPSSPSVSVSLFHSQTCILHPSSNFSL